MSDPLPRRRAAPRRAALAGLLGLVLLLSACGGAEAPGAPGTPRPTTPEQSASASARASARASASAEPAPDPGFGIPRVGQCQRLTYAGSLASVARGKRVGCAQEHTSVVSYVGYLKRPVTPQTPIAQRRALGQRFCEPAFRSWVGGTEADRAASVLTWTLFTPGQAQLVRGARWVRCAVLARSGTTLVARPGARPLLGQGVPEQLRVCQDRAGRDVSCGQPHAYRVTAVYRVVGSTYPTAPAYTPTARARCEELTKLPGGFWQAPSRAGWNAGDRFVRCLAPGTATTP